MPAIDVTLGDSDVDVNVTSDITGTYSDADAVSAINSAAINPNSVTTDELYADDFPLTARVFRSGGTVFSHGRDGLIASGDASAVIQASIDAVADTESPGTGQRIGLTRGIFDIDQTISLDDGTQVRGEGMRATVFSPVNGFDSNVVDYLADTSATDRDFFSGLDEMKIDGNKANNTTGHGIFIDADTGSDDPNDFHINRCFIHRCAENGLQIEFVWGLHLSHILVETNGVDGIQLAGGGQYYITDVFIAFNERDGFRVFDTPHGAVTGLIAQGNGRRGINIQNRSQSTFANSIAFDNGDHGWFLNQGGTFPQDVNLVGCLAQNNGNAGFYIDSDGATLYGCNSFDTQDTPTQKNGIVISASNVRVFGGRCANNSFFDINIGSSSVEPELRGVTFDTINDEGIRTMINGKSYTETASPGSGSSQWDGHETTAHRKNILVEDRSVAAPFPLYRADSAGNWLQVG